MVRFLPVTLFLLVLASSACREDGTVTVRSIKFQGVESVDAALLKASLATREDVRVPIFNWRLPFSGRRNSFNRARFDADLRRVEAFYADRGYPDAKVSSFDVKLNKQQDGVDVTLVVSEGEPTRVGSVELRGFDPIPPDHLATIEKQLPLKIGEPRDRQRLLASHDLAVNELRDHGYPYARVTTSETADPASRSVAVLLTAEPGPLGHFGPVEIVGNKSVSQSVIRRQIVYRPGDLYRRSLLQETQRRLYAMELFQFVNIETLEQERRDPEVKTRVVIAEGRHQKLNGGIGYGTEEKARVDGEYRHVNFLGGARAAGIHGRWSSLDRGARLDFTQPYFFSPSLRFRADGQRWYTYTPAYDSVVTGAKLSVTRQTSARASTTLSFLSERNTSAVKLDPLADPQLYLDLIALGLDPETRKQEGTNGAVALDFQYRTTDNLLNARRGYAIAFQVEDAGRLLPGTFNYYGYSADARYFIPIGSRIVVATRLQGGNLHAAGDDPKQVPFAKKFFLGGASSLRGWGRFEVSPIGGSGLPLGGNTMFAFSSEGRVRLRGKFGGVLFLDTGNVWADHRSVDLNDVRYAVGTGLRYDTPVGPIRFDVGLQLNPVAGLKVNGQEQLRRWRLHFSIGQAF